MADQDSPRTLLEVLVAAMAAGTIDEQQAVLIVVQLIGAGGESTAGLIASAARLLATDLELQTRLRERPELISSFLDEALRLESPFRGHHRHVVADTHLDGVDLPAGSHLLLLWGAANRDPAAYPDPDIVDLNRPRGRATVAFGAGAHFCIGSALARLEATAAITLLLDRTERFSLIDAEPPRWVPSLFARRHATLPLRVTRS
ncbi:cytochrome P450 [Nocardia sp. IBHARD005]|uniref:cytochrome P450 n=1 Tax=Nocardia sp. IBHARD005 TaxID=3457765 RepID=UPI00405A0E80